MTFAYTDHHLALGERCVGNTSTAWLSNLTLRDGKSSRHLTKTMTCLGETVHKGARNPFFLDFLPRNGHLNVKTMLALENSWRLINLSSLRCFKETQSPFSKRPKLMAAKHLKRVCGSVVVVFLFSIKTRRSIRGQGARDAM